MSVMKAALPEEDLDMLTSPASLPVRPAAPAAGVAVAGGAAAAAAAAVKLPPGSLQLPTSFELLASPRASARAVQVRGEQGTAGGRAAAAGRRKQDDGLLRWGVAERSLQWLVLVFCAARGRHC